MAAMITTPQHTNTTGPFVQGLPTHQGWYWFVPNEYRNNRVIGPEPCRVLLGQGRHVRHAVVMWGWNNEATAEKDHPLDSPFVRSGWYAPMAPPEMPA
jgi:hypothetical protein